MNTASKCVGYILLLMVFGVFLRVAWVNFYPYTPIEIQAINILDDDNVVSAGTPMNYETIYKKNIDVQATVQRRLINSYVLTVPPYTRSVPIGAGRTLNQIEIPSFADPGTYRLNIVYTYLVSTFPEKYVSVTATSGPFRVVRREDPLVEAVTRKVLQNTEAMRSMKVEMRGKADKKK